MQDADTVRDVIGVLHGQTTEGISVAVSSSLAIDVGGAGSLKGGHCPISWLEAKHALGWSTGRMVLVLSFRLVFYHTSQPTLYLLIFYAAYDSIGDLELVCAGLTAMRELWYLVFCIFMLFTKPAYFLMDCFLLWRVDYGRFLNFVFCPDYDLFWQFALYAGVAKVEDGLLLNGLKALMRERAWGKVTFLVGSGLIWSSVCAAGILGFILAVSGLQQSYLPLTVAFALPTAAFVNLWFVTISERLCKHRDSSLRTLSMCTSTAAAETNTSLQT